MPALRFHQTGEEVFHLRLKRKRRRVGTVLHGKAQFLRHVRHRQAAFALTSLQPAKFSGPDPGQVGDGPVGTMDLQFGEGGPSGGNSQDSRAYRATASDVQRRVANDQDLVARQIFPQQPGAALMRDGGNLIAVFMIVGEGPRHK